MKDTPEDSVAIHTHYVVAVDIRLAVKPSGPSLPSRLQAERTTRLELQDWCHSIEKREIIFREIPEMESTSISIELAGPKMAASHR